MIKRVVAIALTIMIILCIVGCEKGSYEIIVDVITQKAVYKDKIDISVLVKYAFGINTFEKEAEKKFPNLNIIQVGNYTSNMGTAEYYSRLKNDDLTDIVMTWPLDVGSEYWQERLIDLSTYSVASRYTTKSLNQVSYGKEGKLYYLPGPSQVRGIVYNKTLFKEKGWVVPNDFEGFLQLCQSIEESGMRSLQLGLENSEVLDTAFSGYGYQNSYASPDNAKKTEDYNKGIGSFSDNFMPALETFEKLIDAEVLKSEDLDISYAERETMLFTRQCAMIEDSVLMARMGESLTGTKDEFALMPFFNSGDDNDWARLYNVCFIGLNKHLQDKGNEKKFNLVKQLFDYISTPEGQNALAGDTGAMFSSLKGATIPNVPEIADLHTALSAGRYGVFPTLKNAQEALREGLAGMITGTYSKEDVIKMVDKQNLDPIQIPPAVIYGSAKDNFTLIETGNFVADSMRKYAEADIALFLDNGKDGLFNGKGISGKFYKGEISAVDIQRILPDLKHGERGVLQKISMTGENLIKTLEYSLPVYNQQEGWFYYFSGLKMEFNPSAKPGTRIKRITDVNGKRINKTKIYTIAIMDETVKKEFFVNMEETGKTIGSILIEQIENAKIISPEKDRRFIISN